MSDKEEKTQPGSVDDDATKRAKEANEKKKKMMDALDDNASAWNRGRNYADPTRKKRGRITYG